MYSSSNTIPEFGVGIHIDYDVTGVHPATNVGTDYYDVVGMALFNTLAEADVICKYLNKVGEMVNAAGMKFGYHNHSYEFNKVEGQVWYDYMIKHTDADKVFYEMDVYWAVRGQVSPVEYFKKYPNRFTLLHIKDHKEIGQSGMVGFDAIFRHADIAGVEHIIVEAEAYESADMMEGVGLCADYLLKADFVKADYTK